MTDNYNKSSVHQNVNDSSHASQNSSINLSYQDLQYVTDQELESLIAQSTIRLNLSHNLLSTLPRAFDCLNALTKLSLKHNKFTEFPEILCSLPNLSSLDISQNQLRKLPKHPGNLANLKVLSFACNKIKKLPAYLSQFNKLKILRIDGNPIEGFDPDLLVPLPNESNQSFIKRLLSYPNRSGDVGEMQPAQRSLSNAQSNSNINIDALSKRTTDKCYPSIPDLMPLSNTSDTYFRRISAIPLDHDSEIDTDASTERIKDQRHTELTKKEIRPISQLGYNSQVLQQKHPCSAIVDSVRGILFSVGQIHQSIHQYMIFCRSNSVAEAIVKALDLVNISIDVVIAKLEQIEYIDQTSDPKLLKDAITSLLSKTIEAASFCNDLVIIFKKNLKYFIQTANDSYSRSMYLLLFQSALELKKSYNALILHSTSNVLFPINSNTESCIQRHHSKNPSTAPTSPLRYPVNKLTSLIHDTMLSDESSFSLSPPHSSTPLNLATSERKLLGKAHSSFSSSPTLDHNKISSKSASNPGYFSRQVNETSNIDETFLKLIENATANAIQTLAMLSDTCAKSLLAKSKSSTVSAMKADPLPNDHLLSSKLQELSSMSMSAGTITRTLRLKVRLYKEKKAITPNELYETCQSFIRVVIDVAKSARAISTEIAFSKPTMASLSILTKSTKELAILLSSSVSYSESSFDHTMQVQTPCLSRTLHIHKHSADTSDSNLNPI